MRIGGLVGQANDSTITDSSGAGEVVGDYSVGGLVGELHSSTVQRSYSAGRSIGMYEVGGLIGSTWGEEGALSSVEHSYSTSEVIGRAAGDFDIAERAGGLVGMHLRASITESYSLGQVRGLGDVGGLVGENYALIRDSYSLSSVSGTARVGGLIGMGWPESDIQHAYSAGPVEAPSGAEHIGGLLGRADESSALISSYWDVDVSGLGTDASPRSKGLTTAQMQAQDSFSGWDFTTTWTIAEGEDYPDLRENSRYP